MTDPHHPHSEHDELASAHVDGRTSAAEAARISADPALQARVAALAAVRDALAGLRDDPVDPERRDQTIAAALAAAAASDDPGDADGSEDDVASLAAVAARRSGASPRTLRIVALAAAVALVALVVPFLSRLGDDDRPEDTAAAVLEDSDRETAPDQARPEALDDAAGALPEEGDPFSAGAGSAGTGELEDLGEFDDVDGLASAVRDQVLQGSAPSAGTTSADDGADRTQGGAEESASTVAGCAPEHALPEGATFVLAGHATLDSRLVLVVVYDSDDGERRLMALDATDCSLLATRPL